VVDGRAGAERDGGHEPTCNWIYRNVDLDYNFRIRFRKFSLYTWCQSFALELHVYKLVV